MFQQHQGESLSEAWTRFKDLLQKVPHHGIDRWLQINIFYDHVFFHLKCEIDHAVGSKLRDKNADESWEIIENLALYKHEGWNDSKDFIKPVKAISTSQNTSKNPKRRLLELEDQTNFLLKAHTEMMERFENSILKQRHEINDKMGEMFGLLKELTANRAPEKVLMREETKHPTTKHVNSISLVRVEEDKNAEYNEATNESVLEPDKSDAEIILEEINKVIKTGDEPVVSTE
ncbi:hypothetical protein Tco_0023908 [Tanacetum coccineum]